MELTEFKKGIKFSWIILILHVIFFVFWFLGHDKESVIYPESTYFSSLFFFINPNIFYRLFLRFEFLSFLFGAVGFRAFIFIVSYLISVISFICICVYSIRLFILSWNTNIRHFHTFACLSLVPVIALFFLVLLQIQFLVHRYQIKTKGSSAYEEQFTPEYFEDTLDDVVSEENLAKRTKSTEFTVKHYEKLFVEDKPSILKVIINLINRYIN